MPDVAISCSKEDSLPSFLLEAQTEVLPVVDLDTKKVKESFRDNKSGCLVPAENIAKTYEAYELSMKKQKY